MLDDVALTDLIQEPIPVRTKPIEHDFGRIYLSVIGCDKEQLDVFDQAIVDLQRSENIYSAQYQRPSNQGVLRLSIVLKPLEFENEDRSEINIRGHLREKGFHYEIIRPVRGVFDADPQRLTSKG